MPEEKIVEYEAQWEEQKPQETRERVFIPEDSYIAKLKIIDVFLAPNFKDKTKKEEKLALVFSLSETGKELTHFLAPKITKGSTNKDGKIFSNSKLYDLLCDLGLKDKFKSEIGSKFTAQKVADFLWINLEGKNVKVNVKTSKANTPEQYSTISKVLRFIN